MLRPDNGQNTLHFNQDNHTEQFQNQEPQQFIIVPDQQQDTTTLQNVPDPSETATKQNVSELSDVTVNNTQNFTKTNDSIMKQIPVHTITQYPITDGNLNDTTHNTNQDNTSTLSTSNILITQPFQTQLTSPQNYDPPPPPFSQNSTQTTPHNSPQQSSSNTHNTNAPQIQSTVQCQTTIPTRQPISQTLAYTPAQNTQTRNI